MKNIKYFLATPLFIGLLLSGCNLVGGLLNYGNQSNSSAISENNQFATTNFPLESCGDTLPQDPQAYPLELYSVFLYTPGNAWEEKNDINALKIRSIFCSDALEEQKHSEDNKFFFYHEQYEIGSFIGRERANEFMSLLQNELGNDAIKLGEPVVVEAPPSPITTFHTKEEIGKAAGLTESQIEQLLSLENIPFNSQGQTITRKIKAIVPTYVPRGFKLHELRINRDGLWLSSYYLEYRNPQNYCFSIYDTGGRGDAPARHETIRSIYSHALGYIDLGYTQTSRLSSSARLNHTGFDMVIIDANGQVVKENPSGSDFGYILGFTSGFSSGGGSGRRDQECQQLSLQELVKVIESLHLLNPPQKTNPQSPNNPFQSMSFPKDSCGDSLPEDPDAYPVEFYPVFIDYSESNLESVQSQFCRDSLKIYRKSLDEDYIQVASFVGKERANQFKALIQSKFPNVEIGEVSIIEAP